MGRQCGILSECIKTWLCSYAVRHNICYADVLAAYQPCGHYADTRQAPAEVIVEEVALKPCPFCGSAEHLEVIHADELRDDGCESDSGDAYTVICNYLEGGCGATCGFSTKKGDATIRWNTRAGRRTTAST